MTIHDESVDGEEECVRCPVCHADTDADCEHRRHVYEYIPAFTQEITKVFRVKLLSGTTTK